MIARIRTSLQDTLQIILNDCPGFLPLGARYYVDALCRKKIFCPAPHASSYEILNDFKFEIQPVGFKYFVRLPENIKHIGQKMTLCKMLVKAKKGDTFYSEASDHTCGAGPYLLGQSDIENPFVSGEFGAGLGVFRDNHAASRLYHYIPHIERHVVNYATFSSLDKLPFDPDILVILANINQAEIILRP